MEWIATRWPTEIPSSMNTLASIPAPIMFMVTAGIIGAYYFVKSFFEV